jgi:arsenate reductase-like glutaredoxin family protein
MSKMRVVLGSILKSKSGKPDYVKVRVNDLTRDTLTNMLNATTGQDGFILNLESKKYRTESLDKAVEAGKLSADVAVKIRESIEKMPDYCRFELVTYVEKKQA